MELLAGLVIAAILWGAIEHTSLGSALSWVGAGVNVCLVVIIGLILSVLLGVILASLVRP